MDRQTHLDRLKRYVDTQVRPEYRNDADFIRQASQYNSSFLGDASPELRNNPEFILSVIFLDEQPHFDILEYTSAQLKNTKDFMLPLIRRRGILLETASPALQNDRDVVMAAITQDTRAIDYASPELQQDPEILGMRQHHENMYGVNRSIRNRGGRRSKRKQRRKTRRR
jgi:hypothetical protein